MKTCRSAQSGLASPLTREVSRQLKGIPLSLALDVLLGDLNLGFAVDDDTLVITSRADAERIMTIRRYDVRDLLVDGGNSADLIRTVRLAVPQQLPMLPEVTSDTKLPTSRFLGNRSATEDNVAVFRNTLLVRTTAHGQLAVERLLADVRKDGGRQPRRSRCTLESDGASSQSVDSGPLELLIELVAGEHERRGAAVGAVVAVLGEVTLGD